MPESDITSDEGDFKLSAEQVAEAAEQGNEKVQAELEKLNPTRKS